MAEYINKAEALEEAVRFSIEEGSNTVCSKLYADIFNMSIIDIVHCRDCKHYGTEDDYDMCKLTRILHDDDWFCADGESG